MLGDPVHLLVALLVFLVIVAIAFAIVKYAPVEQPWKGLTALIFLVVGLIIFLKLFGLW